MFGSLHVILGSVVLIANVRDLLVLGNSIVFSSLIIVIDVVIFFICVLVVLMLLGDLEYNVTLLLKAIVVWINEHVLVIIGDVVELLNFLLIVGSLVKDNLFFLNKELRILMLQEWVEHIDIQIFVLLVSLELILLFQLQSLLLIWVVVFLNSLIWRIRCVFPFSSVDELHVVLLGEFVIISWENVIAE